MLDDLSWVREESPAFVAMILVSLVLLLAVRTTVEKTIERKLDSQAKAIELRITRRSAFEDKVLADRYAMVMNLAARLELVVTNTLNRRRSQQAVPDGFQVGNEIVPLTEIFEELLIQRLTLGEEFHRVLVWKANLALAMANASDPELQALQKKWAACHDDLRRVTDQAFAISQIGLTSR